MSRAPSSEPFMIVADRAQYAAFISGESNAERLERLKVTLLRVIDTALTENQREIIMLYFFEGMTVSEIAASRGVAKSTVSRTVARAKKRIEKVMQYWFDENKNHIC